MKANRSVIELLEEKLGRGRIRIDEPLSLRTTFQIGGPADFYYEANSNEELVKAVRLAESLKLPYFILGGGSNILVGDKGFRGLVIKNKSKNIKILGYKGIVEAQKSRHSLGFGGQAKVKSVLIEADAGVPFNQLVRFTIDEGLAGLEEFLGLPGTVGGAVVGNAHWKEKKIEDFVFFKKTIGKLLLSAIFSLKKEENKKTLWERAQEAMKYRQKTQPLNFPSAGCIFKNIKKSQALRIGTPNFTTSAGFLIEAAGLAGTKVGNVQVSPLHADFIVNLDGGKASDVIKLMGLIKKHVFEKFGVSLEEEIIKIGEFS